MTTRTITLEHQLPPTINKLLRTHWTKSRFIRQTWERDLAILGANKIPQAGKGEHRTVTIKLYKGPHGKQDDPTNLDGRSKLVLDALKNIGTIYDDNHEHCTCNIVEVVKSQTKYTQIEIEYEATANA